MKVTIRDVARSAGVSIKTVSRVINKESSVRPETFDKVMAAVTEMNYQPNQAARNLSSSKPYLIGFIYNNPNAYYVIDMQEGILSECRKQGYELLIHPSSKSAESVIDEIKSLVGSSRIAGLILTPPYSENTSLIEALNLFSIKYVRIISGTHNELLPSTLLIDDQSASFEITEHLIQLGHQRIGFLSGSEEHRSSSERLTGYHEALSVYRIETMNNLVLAGEYSFESGVEGAKRLLSLEQPPTAIVACNDEIAAGALFAARLSGFNVPENLSIVGFEDSPFSRQTWPKLTTARQPTSEIAEKATKMLIAQLQDQSRPTKSNNIFKPELVIRDSSSKPSGYKSNSRGS